MITDITAFNFIREFADGKGEPAEKYPGVTRVLSATKDTTGLDQWRANVGEEEADRIVEESKVIGSSLDGLFNDYLESKIHPSRYLDSRTAVSSPTAIVPPSRDEVGYPLFEQLLPHLKRIEPYAVQLKVWSDKLRIMGYLDCIGEYDGVPSIIDCKNSRREKQLEHLEDYFLQCTAYSMMILEQTGGAIRQIVLPIAVRNSMVPQIVVRPIGDYVLPVIKRIKAYYA